MSHPSSRMDLLYTRLRPPPVREKQVVRFRLLERLAAALRQRLTLVCAPAGYGKTTLLSQWVERLPGPAGWVSLDRGDNDLAQFLRYLLAAIQRIDPGVGALIPRMLQPPRPLSISAAWIVLINDLAASHKEFILILDDYQEIENPAVHQALEYLIEHTPANLHWIVAARSDPPINLPQLRARGQLLELRAAELCFTGEDARLFFQDRMGMPLTEREVAALVQKAEGWAAGLQIAAILLQNQPDLPGAVQAFTGSHRYILDYFAREVIERLPGSTQEFLCQTAILDHLEASLCDAVTGRSDSRQILEQLDREDYFIVPLDAGRRWYRCHRLMVEAFRRKTEGLEPAQLAGLHQRAGAWYAAQGMIDAAIEHAFKAGDLDRAAEWIEAGAETILKRSQVAKLLEWLESLSEEQIRRRPRLNTAYAWALLLKGGSPRAVQARLEASAGLAADAGAGADAEAGAGAEETVIRALIATLSGDVRQGFACSQRALAELPAAQIFLRSVAYENLGMGYVIQGDIQSAIQAFKESIALARDSGNTMFAVASLSNLGGLYLIQGQLKFAEAVYRQALELATTQFGRRLPVACRALLGLSEIAREWNNLAQARELLEEAVQLSQQYSETGELVMVLSLARVLQEQGHVEEALTLLQKAQASAIQRTATPINDRLVEAALARLWLRQGNLTAAAEWAARRGFDPDLSAQALPLPDARAIPYDLRAGEWLLYARLQLAQNRPEAALNTLAAPLSEATQQGRTRRLHEILVLMALAYQLAGSVDRALDALERSLKLAEPEGYARVYIDEGPPMIGLLREAARRGIQKAYCHRLLSAFPPEDRGPQRASGAGQAGLVEPLSERELEVLRLLAEGCTNREVGERLVISLSTVKGHISNIIGKLDARNRTEAVARARQLGILPGD